METFWSVRANKVMEIVPMEATEKGVERGREKEGESQRLILTMLSASLPACSRLFLPLLARYTFGREEEEKRRDSEKLEMRRKKGEEEAVALGWSGGGYSSLFAEGERFTSELPYWIRQ